MYKCKSKECKDVAPVMTDKYIKMEYADGRSGDICIFCSKKFSKLEEISKERVAPMIKSVDCSGGSKQFAH